jgi:hypothetical protein
MNKRGQVTIFLIVAIIIVGSVALIFFLRGGVDEITSQGDITPGEYIKSCIEDKLNDGIKIVSENGGDINPELFYELEGKNISYLCYNNNNYLRCINQRPLLINHVNNEIKNYIEEDVKNCFEDLIEGLKKKNDEVQYEYGGFELIFRKNFLQLKFDADLTVINKEDSRKYNNFDLFIDSRLYNNLVVAQEIVSQEAEYCNFETIGFSLIYPEFGIDRFELGDSTTYYKITNKKSQEEFQFLVRSCVIPPGF